MKGFAFRLIPPRATFPGDMTDAERKTMLEHVAYWTARSEEGTALAFGPVGDPAGSYGLGIFLAADDEAAQKLCDEDPAIRSPHGFRAELRPFVQLVTPQGTY